MRPIIESDAIDLYEYAKSKNVGPNAGWKPHENIEETIEVIKSVFIKQNGVFGMILPNSDKLIGSLGIINDPKRQNDQVKMLGYSLGEDYWGMGYMTEAAQAIIKYGFEKFQLSLISAYCYPENKRSRRILQKLGFHYEGTLSLCEEIYDGRVFDNECYALSIGEWLKNN